MRIGFVSLYSWRPHVEHLYYLADLVRKAGHEAEFLTCDADLPACYTRELRSIRPDWQECLMCRIGGIRSYTSRNVSSFGEYSRGEVCLPQEAKTWGLSSVSTLGRFESDDDFSSEAFLAVASRLQPSVEKAYRASSNWIDDRRVKALVVFNGRMDATRAIFDAGLNKGIPVASLERTWFGDGLQILPQENCLGLRSVDNLVSEWADKPLTGEQAARGASHIASRFLRRNQNEWRAYNVNADIQPWPAAGGGYKILLIPGSRNEIWGHPDWDSGWVHPLDAYDALIDHFRLKPSDLLLRCHPNWGEKIGKSDGHLAENYYTQWANKRGVLVIPSTSTVSTLGLIEQADAIVVASGSAALEAGALGKQVIAIAASNYQKAGIREDACDIDRLKALKLRVELPSDTAGSIAERIRRQTLRFAYTITYRVPQYVDYVRSVTPTQYVYKEGADASRLIRLLQTGILSPDDLACADNSREEYDVLDLMREKRWEELIRMPDLMTRYRPLKRRFPYVGIDNIRSRMRHGDR